MVEVLVATGLDLDQHGSNPGAAGMIQVPGFNVPAFIADTIDNAGPDLQLCGPNPGAGGVSQLPGSTAPSFIADALVAAGSDLQRHVSTAGFKASSVEAQCATAENIAKVHSVPIFGLSGPEFETTQGHNVNPGPMFWAATRDSYTESLEQDNGYARLHEATGNPSAAASPNAGVTYMRTSGSHLAGKAGANDGPPQSPMQPGKVRIVYRCSQSFQANKAKWGHDGVRKPAPVAPVAAGAVNDSSGPGTTPASKRRAVVAANDCDAKFVAALRNSKSRQTMCSICKVVLVKFDASAPADPVPHPAAMVNGVCPWAASMHVVRPGIRVVLASTRHCNHWPRWTRLAHRVSPKLAGEMLSMQQGSGAPTPVVAAHFADQTGGRLSSGQVSKVLRRAKGDGAKDTGVHGLLEQLQGRGDVVILAKWRVVRQDFVHNDYSVVNSDKALKVVYELCCPATACSLSAHWDVTALIDTESDCEWSALDLFRDGKTPAGLPGVESLSHFSTSDGFVLNAGAIYWVTSGQSVEASRCMFLEVTDTTCKTNSSVMEYGVDVVKNSRGESLQGGNYLLNGLSKANHGFKIQARRFLMGPTARGIEYRLTDGDPHLIAATEVVSPHGLCRAHTVNFSMRKMWAEQGLTQAERDDAADIKDRIHFINRSCETEPELLASHRELIAHIDAGLVPRGPTRKRRAKDRKGGATTARRQSAGGSRRKIGKKFEVARFLGYSSGQLEVAWVGFTATTQEPVANVHHDLGPAVFDAFCRAANLEVDPSGALSSPGPAVRAIGDPECEDTAHTVQRFDGVLDGKVIVKWAGSRQTTVELPEGLMGDVGAAQFRAFCNAANITEASLKFDFAARRDARVTLSSIMKAWYLGEIWPKRLKLAWCYRRGIMHMGNDTTGAAECNFNQLKSRKSASAVTDKSSLRTLGERLHEQERLRLVNIREGRATEFSMVPAAAAGVPSEFLASWTRAGLALVSREASRAGLGGVAKYLVLPVPPQAGSNATAAWAVRHTGEREGGGAHRTRVVHFVDGRGRCTCWTWEVWSIECRHCLSIHGSVAITSASPFWRQGTAMGVNDGIINTGAVPRDLGPKARTPNVHSGDAGSEPPPPRLAVRFCDRHVELVEDDDAVGPTVPPRAPVAPSQQGSARGDTAETAGSNFAVGQACGALFDEIVAMVSGSGTTPTVSAAILVKAKSLHAEAASLVSAAATTRQGERLDTTVNTQMRPSRKGPGSSSRSKGSYEVGSRH